MPISQLTNAVVRTWGCGAKETRAQIPVPLLSKSTTSLSLSLLTYER